MVNCQRLQMRPAAGTCGTRVLGRSKVRSAAWLAAWKLLNCSHPPFTLHSFPRPPEQGFLASLSPLHPPRRKVLRFQATDGPDGSPQPLLQVGEEDHHRVPSHNHFSKAAANSLPKRSLATQKTLANKSVQARPLSLEIPEVN